MLSNAEGVARYVGSYVSSEWRNRSPQDRRLRTLRYSLKGRVATLPWSWAGGAALVWRAGVAAFASYLGTNELKEALGTRWAWHWRGVISSLGRHAAEGLKLASERSDCDDFATRLAKITKVSAAILEWEAAQGVAVDQQEIEAQAAAVLVAEAQERNKDNEIRIQQ